MKDEDKLRGYGTNDYLIWDVSFEELFPSLTGFSEDPKKLLFSVREGHSHVYNERAISNYCVDKQLLREAIDKLSPTECDSGTDEDNFPVKNNCPYWVEIEEDPFYSHCACRRKKGIYKQLLKELGL